MVIISNLESHAIFAGRSGHGRSNRIAYTAVAVAVAIIVAL